MLIFCATNRLIGSQDIFEEVKRFQVRIPLHLLLKCVFLVLLLNGDGVFVISSRRNVIMFVVHVPFEMQCFSFTATAVRDFSMDWVLVRGDGTAPRFENCNED